MTDIGSENRGRVSGAVSDPQPTCRYLLGAANLFHASSSSATIVGPRGGRAFCSCFGFKSALLVVEPDYWPNVLFLSCADREETDICAFHNSAYQAHPYLYLGHLNLSQYGVSSRASHTEEVPWQTTSLYYFSSPVKSRK